LGAKYHRFEKSTSYLRKRLLNDLVDQRFLPQAVSLDEMFIPVVTVNE